MHGYRFFTQNQKNIRNTIILRSVEDLTRYFSRFEIETHDEWYECALERWSVEVIEFWISIELSILCWQLNASNEGYESTSIRHWLKPKKHCFFSIWNPIYRHKKRRWRNYAACSADFNAEHHSGLKCGRPQWISISLPRKSIHRHPWDSRDKVILN